MEDYIKLAISKEYPVKKVILFNFGVITILALMVLYLTRDKLNLSIMYGAIIYSIVTSLVELIRTYRILIKLSWSKRSELFWFETIFNVVSRFFALLAVTAFIVILLFK